MFPPSPIHLFNSSSGRGEKWVCLGIAGSLFLPSMRTKKISSKLTLPGAQLVTAESGSPGAEGGQCTGTLGLPAPWGTRVLCTSQAGLLPSSTGFKAYLCHFPIGPSGRVSGKDRFIAFSQSGNNCNPFIIDGRLFQYFLINCYDPQQ